MKGNAILSPSQNEIHKGELNVTTERMQEKFQASSWLADLWEGPYAPLRLPRGGSPGILQDSKKENPVSSGLGSGPMTGLSCASVLPLLDSPIYGFPGLLI